MEPCRGSDTDSNSVRGAHSLRFHVLFLPFNLYQFIRSNNLILSSDDYYTDSYLKVNYFWYILLIGIFWYFFRHASQIHLHQISILTRWRCSQGTYRTPSHASDVLTAEFCITIFFHAGRYQSASRRHDQDQHHDHRRHHPDQLAGSSARAPGRGIQTRAGALRYHHEYRHVPFAF